MAKPAAKRVRLRDGRKISTVSFRPADLEVLQRLQDKYGMDVTNIVRLALRRLAELPADVH